MSIAPLTNATPTRNMLSVTNFRMLTSAMSRSRRAAAQHLAHGGDKLQRALVAHGIIDVVGTLSRTEDALFPEDRQVLRDVALGSPDRLDDVLYAQLVLAQDAQDLQPQRMGNRKSTRLNSSHGYSSYAVFCLNKKQLYQYHEKYQPHQK